MKIVKVGDLSLGDVFLLGQTLYIVNNFVANILVVSSFFSLNYNKKINTLQLPLNTRYLTMSEKRITVLDYGEINRLLNSI